MPRFTSRPGSRFELSLYAELPAEGAPPALRAVLGLAGCPVEVLVLRASTRSRRRLLRLLGALAPDAAIQVGGRLRSNDATEAWERGRGDLLPEMIERRTWRWVQHPRTSAEHGWVGGQAPAGGGCRNLTWRATACAAPPRAAWALTLRGDAPATLAGLILSLHGASDPGPESSAGVAGVSADRRLSLDARVEDVADLRRLDAGMQALLPPGHLCSFTWRLPPAALRAGTDRALLALLDPVREPMDRAPWATGDLGQTEANVSDERLAALCSLLARETQLPDEPDAGALERLLATWRRSRDRLKRGRSPRRFYATMDATLASWRERDGAAAQPCPGSRVQLTFLDGKAQMRVEYSMPRARANRLRDRLRLATGVAFSCHGRYVPPPRRG